MYCQQLPAILNTCFALSQIGRFIFRTAVNKLYRALLTDLPCIGLSIFGNLEREGQCPLTHSVAAAFII